MRLFKLIASFIFIFSITLLITACRTNDEADDAPDDADISDYHEAPVVLEEFSFSRESFPRMDGSPMTVPLAQATACVLLGESRENVAEMTMFTRTTQAFRNLVAGQSDILIVGEPAPHILELPEEHDFSFEMAPIALDALVFIVCKSNPVDNLTTGQLRDIYTGSITNWQQLGGSNEEITAFQRNEEAASQVLMQKLVMDWQPMMDAPMQSFSIIYEAEEGITAIRGFDGSPGAIGYTLFYYADVMKMAEGFKILTIDGVKPGNDTIKSGEYPLLNPYYAVINANEPEDGHTRVMYKWLLSGMGQAVIGGEGYVPIKDSSQSEQFVRPELRWDVKTDDSGLVSFSSAHSMHTRLSSGQMQEFVPSGTYNKILPYTSAVTMNDGSLRVSGYGFVTEDGMVITDPVYDGIIRTEYVTTTSAIPLPAYHVRIGSPDPDSIFGIDNRNAACALDGSWITSFDYVDIVFSEDVIFLMRDHESFDIDVINYSGQQLYNISELEWAENISEDTWAEMFVYGVSEGFGFILLSDGLYGLVDIMTGSIRNTDFYGAISFSEGLAAVVTDDGNNLWGFVNKDLEFVITPEYSYTYSFRNGRAIVTMPVDGVEREHVIDEKGDVLFSVASEYIILHNHDGNGFTVTLRDTLRDDWEPAKFYTNDFIEITHPAEARLLGPESQIFYAGEGWYYCMTEDGVWLFNNTSEYLLPMNRHFAEFADGYFIYFEANEEFTVIRYGVMLPDGTEIIPPSDMTSIQLANNNGTVEAFIINTNTTYGQFINETYTPALYKLISTNGNVISTGPGIMSYDDTLQLYYVQGTDFFAWMDIQGNTIISIPSMAYSFD